MMNEANEAKLVTRPIVGMLYGLPVFAPALPIPGMPVIGSVTYRKDMPLKSQFGWNRKPWVKIVIGGRA